VSSKSESPTPKRPTSASASQVRSCGRISHLVPETSLDGVSDVVDQHRRGLTTPADPDVMPYVSASTTGLYVPLEYCENLSPGAQNKAASGQGFQDRSRSAPAPRRNRRDYRLASRAGRCSADRGRWPSVRCHPPSAVKLGARGNARPQPRPASVRALSSLREPLPA
jgi:hypothetical protein